MKNRGGQRPGAGRKPIANPKKNKTLKISIETHHQLKALSTQLNQSQAVIIESLVKKAFHKNA